MKKKRKEAMNVLFQQFFFCFFLKKFSAKRAAGTKNYRGRKIAIVAGRDSGKWQVILQ